MKVRHKVFVCPVETLHKLITTYGTACVTNGILEDATLVRATIDPLTLQLLVVCEHTSFPEVDISDSSELQRELITIKDPY